MSDEELAAELVATIKAKQLNDRRGHRWTDAEMQKLVGLWLQGTDVLDIAKEFTTTIHAINHVVHRLRKNGVPLPRRKQGHRAGRRNTPWTQEEVEYVIRRRNDKATVEEIAVELDRTFGGVTSMIGTLRGQGVNVRMLGNGTRKLWDPEKLRQAIVGRGLRVVGADEPVTLTFRSQSEGGSHRE